MFSEDSEEEMVWIWSLLGWGGAFLMLSSYLILIIAHIKPNSSIYIWMNIIGGTMMVLNTVHFGAYPSAFSNCIWVLISVLAFLKPVSR